MGHQPGIATAFEQQVRKLGLDPHTWAGSKELRRWCERNKNRCYIPEWLLERWGIAVEPDSTMEGTVRAA
jgi:hypothetical protein